MAQVVTRSQVVAELAERLNVSDKEALGYANTVFDFITDALTEGKRIELRNFGSFWVKHRRARQGRNPMTGETVAIKSRCTVQFRPGKTLRELVEFQRQVELRNQGDK